MWDLCWANWHWGRFSPGTSVSPTNHHSTKFSILSITWGRYNRPIGGRRVEWTQLDSTPPPPIFELKKIATGYGLDGREAGVRFSVGDRFFSSPRRPDRFWGPPRLHWVPETLSPGIKRPGSEADHSPPTTVEVMNTWIYTSTPHTSSWCTACLVKQRDNVYIHF
jgi:hypothetical protein